MAGAKTCTRRDWNPTHAAKFKAGMLVDAWNTSPRNVKGNPHKVATIRLTADPLWQPAALAPEADYLAEGFAYLDNRNLKVDGWTPPALWAHWHSGVDANMLILYVVRFQVLEYMEGPLS